MFKCVCFSHVSMTDYPVQGQKQEELQADNMEIPKQDFDGGQPLEGESKELMMQQREEE